jgi:hypothetical protein
MRASSGIRTHDLNVRAGIRQRGHCDGPPEPVFCIIPTGDVIFPRMYQNCEGPLINKIIGRNIQRLYLTIKTVVAFDVI